MHVICTMMVITEAVYRFRSGYDPHQRLTAVILTMMRRFITPLSAAIGMHPDPCQDPQP